MRGHSAHFSSSSSPFWGALLFQQEPGLSKARIFLQAFLSQPLWFLSYLSPPTKGKQDFLWFFLHVDPCETSASWRSRAARPGTARLRGMLGPQKGLFRFPGFPAVLLNHTTYPAVVLCFLVMHAFLFVCISQYLQNFNERVACTWQGVCCSHNEACIEPGATEARSQRMLLSPL